MTEVPSNGPTACNHIFLHELAKLSVGAKVRFLGCYDVTQGYLLLEHTSRPSQAPPVNIKIDVNLVLETSKREVFDIGSWVNIIGYVRVSASGRSKRRRASRSEFGTPPYVLVQAVLLWSAGSLRVDEYERALERQREARKTANEVTAAYNSD